MKNIPTKEKEKGEKRERERSAAGSREGKRRRFFF